MLDDWGGSEGGVASTPKLLENGKKVYGLIRDDMKKVNPFEWPYSDPKQYEGTYKEHDEVGRKRSGYDGFIILDKLPDVTDEGIIGDECLMPEIFPEESMIEPRDWLYGFNVVRKHVSAVVAPGGVGKSALMATETLAMVTGKKLMGKWVKGPLRVLTINLEDGKNEMRRRFVATMKHFGLTQQDLGGRLFMQSGRDDDEFWTDLNANGDDLIERTIIPLHSDIAPDIRTRAFFIYAA